MKKDFNDTNELTFSKKDEILISKTSYSPCFRKEIDSHGLEERGLYRVHQFKKKEMNV